MHTWHKFLYMHTCEYIHVFCLPKAFHKTLMKSHMIPHHMTPESLALIQIYVWETLCYKMSRWVNKDI